MSDSCWSYLLPAYVQNQNEKEKHVEFSDRSEFKFGALIQV